MDIDLAGRVNNQLDHIKDVVGTVCEVDVEPDGVAFNRASIEVSRIQEDADYEGVRVQFHATLARARIPMQLDIGFGDVITPGPTHIEYPSLLDFPAPLLRAYPKETVVAEKLEALTALGLLNSRMKDFYDLAILPRMYPFEGECLVKAISATFRHRGTTIEADPYAPGIEIGRASDTFRRIRITSQFGLLTVFVTDGHLPYPYGREMTGYEVANLSETLKKAKAAGATVLVEPYSFGDRRAAMVQFPGGYIAEIHSISGSRPPCDASLSLGGAVSGSAVMRAGSGRVAGPGPDL